MGLTAHAPVLLKSNDYEKTSRLRPRPGTAVLAQGQQKPPTAAEALQKNFNYVNNKILEMAQDFPAEKYDYKLRPETRTFGAVIVHIASGNIYAAKAGMGEKVKWDDQEQDPAKYTARADCVALLKKSIEDANAALKANPEGPAKNMQPFLAVLQHASEHYGLLVAYYRANGLCRRSRAGHPGASGAATATQADHRASRADASGTESEFAIPAWSGLHAARWRTQG